jgi:hypothetical protein
MTQALGVGKAFSQLARAHIDGADERAVCDLPIAFGIGVHCYSSDSIGRFSPFIRSLE